jgi:hypothetical protein
VVARLPELSSLVVGHDVAGPLAVNPGGNTPLRDSTVDQVLFAGEDGWYSKRTAVGRTISACW